MHPRPDERAHLTGIDPADLPTLISGHRRALVVLSDRPAPPRDEARPGDLVYLRTASGRVVAAGRVERIESFDDLTSHDLRLLRETHGPRTVGTGSVWTASPDARHATIVWLTGVRPVIQPEGVPAGLLHGSNEAWVSAPVESGVGIRRAA